VAIDVVVQRRSQVRRRIDALLHQARSGGRVQGIGESLSAVLVVPRQARHDAPRQPVIGEELDQYFAVQLCPWPPDHRLKVVDRQPKLRVEPIVSQQKGIDLGRGVAAPAAHGAA
jgi:hypothetical protein